MEQLGIEPKLLLAQIVNFGIIMFVLTKVLYKPILEMLEKRRTEIQKGLDLTRKMEEEEQKQNEKREKLMDQARKDVRKLLDEAAVNGRAREKEIVDEARKEATEIIEKARSEVEKIKSDAMQDVKKQSVDMAVAMASRLTRDILDKDVQHKLIAKQLKELEKQ